MFHRQKSGYVWVEARQAEIQSGWRWRLAWSTFMLSCEGVARCVIRQLQQLPSRICSSSLVVRQIKFQGVLFKLVSGKKEPRALSHGTVTQAVTQDDALNRDSGHSRLIC